MQTKQQYKRAAMPRRKRCRRHGVRRVLLIFAALMLTAYFAGKWLLPHKIDMDGLYSPNAVLIEAGSGRVLAQKNADEQIYPASLTKIMTVLLAIEACPDLGEEITLPADIFAPLQAQGASMAGFEAGETVPVRDLLYGALLPSGAECCVALAQHISGSEAAFAELMNNKAQELGMSGTYFCNSTGLHDEAHVSTVSDIAVLLRAALQNETFREIFTAERHSVQTTAQHPQGFTFYSSLLSQIDGEEIPHGEILGGKTGYTSEAGLCLASLAEVRGEEYILVTAGALGNHSTEQYNISDAISVYSQLALGAK